MDKKNKELMLVYQDCPMCGSREKWGMKQVKVANAHGFVIVKKPFYQTGVKGLIMEAVKSGTTRLPFFTDGKKFGYSVEDFIPKKKTARRRKKKTTRKDTDGASTKG